MNVDLYKRACTIAKGQSIEEVTPIMKDLFAFMDQDQDGKVSREEHTAYVKAFMACALEQMPEEARAEA